MTLADLIRALAVYAAEHPEHLTLEVRRMKACPIEPAIEGRLTYEPDTAGEPWLSLD